MDIKNYFLHEEAELEDLGHGIKRKILAYHDNLMVVEVHFEKDAVGTLHTHPHEQITYILEGEFEFNINGHKKILRKGDSTFKEPDIMHGAVCLEKGKLLDIFTPCRQDFMNKKEEQE